MKSYLRFYYLLLLLSQMVLGSSAQAQDTESKDEKTIITIFIRMKLEPSPCFECYDTLSAKIKRLEGVRKVKVYAGKSLVRFEMPSTQVVNESDLMKMAEDAKLTPMNVEYHKEPLDPEKEEGAF